jgi:hypothetical protein
MDRKYRDLLKRGRVLKLSLVLASQNEVRLFREKSFFSQFSLIIERSLESYQISTPIKIRP